MMVTIQDHCMGGGAELLRIKAGMGRCVQRPVMVLEGCELLAWHAMFRGLDGLR